MVYIAVVFVSFPPDQIKAAPSYGLMDGTSLTV